MFRKISICYVTFLLSCHFLFSQSVTGSLEGFIQDNQNNPLAGTNITLQGKSLLGVTGGSTDSNGYFKIVSEQLFSSICSVTAVCASCCNRCKI